MKAIWCLVAGLVLATPTLAQRVDFTGTWRLDLNKSFLGGAHMPANYELTKVIVQHADTLEQTEYESHVVFFGAPRPDSHWSTQLVADGQDHQVLAPSTFPGRPASEARVSVEWQGNNLVIHAAGNSPFGGIWTSERRYFLSVDGAVLTELVNLRMGVGAREQRLIFEKVATPNH